MAEILQSTDSILITFWYIAIPVSLVFLVQAGLTFAGGGDLEAHTDTDTGHTDSPMELFTLRNLINFLLGFSWGGICFYNSIQNKTLLIIAALVVGVIFVTLFFYIIQQVKKLEQDNTFDYNNVIGMEAEVYLKIPEAHTGKGKISVSYKGTTHELDAVTETGPLATGDKVVILDILDDHVLLVKAVE